MHCLTRYEHNLVNNNKTQIFLGMSHEKGVDEAPQRRLGGPAQDAEAECGRGRAVSSEA